MTGRFRCLRRGFSLLAVLAAAVAALAAPGMAGRMEGGVGGELQIEALPALGLRWRMELGGPEGGLRLAADAPGVTMRLDAVPSSAGNWRWRIAKGAVDLAELWPVLKPALGKDAGDWVVEGKAVISGEGVWIISLLLDKRARVTGVALNLGQRLTQARLALGDGNR